MSLRHRPLSPLRRRKMFDLAKKVRQVEVDPLLEGVAQEGLVGGAAVGAEGVQRVGEGVHGIPDKVLVVLKV